MGSAPANAVARTARRWRPAASSSRARWPLALAAGAIAWTAFGGEPAPGPPSVPTAPVGPPLPRIEVDAFRFLGATRLHPDDWARLLTTVTNSSGTPLLREIRSEPHPGSGSGTVIATVSNLVDQADLERVRTAVGDLYLRRRYLNSGALLPDQQVTNRMITFQIVEGSLGAIHVHGARHLREDWVRRRLAAGVTTPLSLDDLSAALRELRLNPNVATVEASLRPEHRGTNLVAGGSVLDLRLREVSPWRLGFQIDNQRPPDVGAEQLTLDASHESLTGHSDPLRVHYGVAQRARDDEAEFSGLDNLGIEYSLPVSVQDTRLGASFNRRDYAIIAEPFQDLDIASEYWDAGFRITQPLRIGPRDNLLAGLSFDRRHSEGSLLGEPFSFSPGSVDGQSDVTALRLAVDWSRPWTNQVLAARLITSLGLDALGATVSPRGPDGRFVSLLGQVQYLRKLWDHGGRGPGDAAHLTARVSAQWADDPLLAMEQLSLGGAGTVRGYRENFAVRDLGVLATVESRIQVFRSRTGRYSLDLVPFADLGAGWNVEASNQDGITLGSLGLGLRATFFDRVQARFDWGYALDHRPDSVEDVQDLGIHFSVGIRAF